MTGAAALVRRAPLPQNDRPREAQCRAVGDGCGALLRGQDLLVEIVMRRQLAAALLLLEVQDLVAHDDPDADAGIRFGKLRHRAVERFHRRVAILDLAAIEHGLDMDCLKHVERGIAAQLAIRLDAPLVACNVGHDLDCFAGDQHGRDAQQDLRRQGKRAKCGQHGQAPAAPRLGRSLYMSHTIQKSVKVC